MDLLSAVNFSLTWAAFTLTSTWTQVPVLRREVPSRQYDFPPKYIKLFYKNTI